VVKNYKNNNSISLRYDIHSTIPSTLNSIRNRLYNDMSHYNYKTIQVQWFED